MLAAHRQVVDLHVVVRLAADGDALLGERDLLEHLPVHAEYQFRHDRTPEGYFNHAKSLPTTPRGPGYSRTTRTSITDTLSRPPLSLAICTSCCAASSRFAPRSRSVAPMSSSPTMSHKPSEQSR